MTGLSTSHARKGPSTGAGTIVLWALELSSNTASEPLSGAGDSNLLGDGEILLGYCDLSYSFSRGTKGFQHAHKKRERRALFSQAPERLEALGSSGIEGREPAIDALARQRLQGGASWELGKPVPATTECASSSPYEESGTKTVSRSLQTHKPKQSRVRAPKHTFQRS